MVIRRDDIKNIYAHNELPCIKMIDRYGNELWTKGSEPFTPITRNYLRFYATDGDLHIGVNDLSLFNNLECAVDFEENWMAFPADGVDVPNGSSLYLRGDGTSTSTSSRKFTTSVPCECHGNVMSLLNKDTFETLKTCTKYCFLGLFSNTSIKTAPELPATKLAERCYNSMFYYCSSLMNAPELPATELELYCYSQMFWKCNNLNSIVTYAINWNTNYANNWLLAVSSSGTVYAPNEAKNIPLNSANGVPSGWTLVKGLP